MFKLFSRGILIASKSSITLTKFYAYRESWITSWVHLFWNTFFLNLPRIFIGIHRRIQETSNMKLFYHNSALKICSCYSNQLLNVLVTSLLYFCDEWFCCALGLLLQLEHKARGEYSTTQLCGYFCTLN